MSKLLLSDQTENTDGSQTTLTLSNTLNHSKFYTVVAYGTWDTATVTLKLSPDSGTTWITVGTSTTFTADGWANVYINPGADMVIRGDVTSVGASTSVSLKIF